MAIREESSMKRLSLQKIQIYLVLLLFTIGVIWGITEVLSERSFISSSNLAKPNVPTLLISAIFLFPICMWTSYLFLLFFDELYFFKNKRRLLNEGIHDIIKYFLYYFTVFFVILLLFKLLNLLSLLNLFNIFIFILLPFVILVFLLLLFKKVNLVLLKKILKKIFFFRINLVLTFFLLTFILDLLSLSMISTVNIQLDKEFYTCNDTLLFKAEGVNIKKFEGIHFSMEPLINTSASPNELKDPLIEIHPLEYDNSNNNKKIVYGKVDLNKTKYCREECNPYIPNSIDDFNLHAPIFDVDYKPNLLNLEKIFDITYSSWVEVPIYCK